MNLTPKTQSFKKLGTSGILDTELLFCLECKLY